jgi:hypothetical protein
MKTAGLLALDLPLFAGIDAADLDGIDVSFRKRRLARGRFCSISRTHRGMCIS